MRIKEVIVVEGHHDTNVLQQYFDCETIETNGLALSAETLELIKEATASAAESSSLPIRIIPAKKSVV